MKRNHKRCGYNTQCACDLLSHFLISSTVLQDASTVLLVSRIVRYPFTVLKIIHSNDGISLSPGHPPQCYWYPNSTEHFLQIFPAVIQQPNQHTNHNNMSSKLCLGYRYCKLPSKFDINSDLVCKYFLKVLDF